MLGIVFRFVSLVLVALALVLLGADAISSLERGGQLTVHSIDQVWTLVSSSSIAAFKAWLAHKLPSPAPSWFYSVLALPAWSFTGVLGVVIAFLFGRHAAETP